MSLDLYIENLNIFESIVDKSYYVLRYNIGNGEYNIRFINRDLELLLDTNFKVSCTEILNLIVKYNLSQDLHSRLFGSSEDIKNFCFEVYTIDFATRGYLDFEIP